MWTNNVLDQGGKITTFDLDVSSKTVLLHPDYPCNGLYSWTCYIVRYPCIAYYKIVNTARLIFNGDLYRTFTGYFSFDSTVSKFSTYFENWNLLHSKKIAEQVLSNHRNDPEGFFALGKNEQVGLDILQKIFSEESVTAEDCIMTCSPSATKKYRDQLHKFFSSKATMLNRKKIYEQVQVELERWELWAATNERNINITQNCRKFSTLILSQYLFGCDHFSADLGETLNIVNAYALKKVIGALITSQEEKELKLVAQKIQEIINSTLSNVHVCHSLVKDMHAAQFTTIQIKIMVCVLLVAGIETTSAFLSYILWQLGRQPSGGEAIFHEIEAKKLMYANENLPDNLLSVWKIMLEAMRLFTPSFAIFREARKDLACEIRSENGDLLQLYAISKGDSLVVLPCLFGRDEQRFGVGREASSFNPNQVINQQPPPAFFGMGVHSCPGQWLAKEEIKQFLTYFFQRYMIQTAPEEIDLVGFLTTLKMKKDVTAKLILRSVV